MFQIDEPNAPTTPPPVPAAGTPGWFQAGNAALGRAPIAIRYWWLNMLQAEILNVLNWVGIAPSKTNNGQLLASLQAAHFAIPMVLRQVTSSGSFTVTAGIPRLRFRARGAGAGGGAGGGNTQANVSSGGGGGPGGYAEAILPVALGDVISWTIGAGGTGGAPNGLSGSNGGDTIVYKNGIEMFRVTGGGGGSNATSGGLGQAGTSGQFVPSSAGIAAGLTWMSYQTGGQSLGVYVSATETISGQGGAGFGFPSVTENGSNQNGQNATLPSCGGAGGLGNDSGGNGAGGELVYEQ